MSKVFVRCEDPNCPDPHMILDTDEGADLCMLPNHIWCDSPTAIAYRIKHKIDKVRKEAKEFGIPIIVAQQTNQHKEMERFQEKAQEITESVHEGALKTPREAIKIMEKSFDRQEEIRKELEHKCYTKALEKHNGKEKVTDRMFNRKVDNKCTKKPRQNTLAGTACCVGCGKPLMNVGNNQITVMVETPLYVLCEGCVITIERHTKLKLNNEKITDGSVL